KWPDLRKLAGKQLKERPVIHLRQCARLLHGRKFRPTLPLTESFRFDAHAFSSVVLAKPDSLARPHEDIAIDGHFFSFFGGSSHVSSSPRVALQVVRIKKYRPETLSMNWTVGLRSVAFTGHLTCMTREEAFEAVRSTKERPASGPAENEENSSERVCRYCRSYPQEGQFIVGGAAV